MMRRNVPPWTRVHEVRFGKLSVAIDDIKAEVETRARQLAEQRLRAARLAEVE